MKKKRKFYFKKYVEILDYHFDENILDTTYDYKTINDIHIAREILSLLSKNKIEYKDLKDWSFSDYDFCWVEIRTTKDNYFRFVADFMDTFDGYMEDYRFN